MRNRRRELIPDEPPTFEDIAYLLTLLARAIYPPVDNEITYELLLGLLDSDVYDEDAVTACGILIRETAATPRSRGVH